MMHQPWQDCITENHERDETHLHMPDGLIVRSFGYPKTATMSISCGHGEEVLHTYQNDRSAMF